MFIILLYYFSSLINENRGEIIFAYFCLICIDENCISLSLNVCLKFSIPKIALYKRIH